MMVYVRDKVNEPEDKKFFLYVTSFINSIQLCLRRTFQVPAQQWTESIRVRRNGSLIVQLMLGI